ncbi:MAG: PD40 domain-containing protein, partial [Acidobacteriota bacterium]
TSMPGDENNPSLSPDGKQMAYVQGHFTGGNIEVIQIAATEGLPLRLTHSGRDTGPAWAPDGSSIFFLRLDEKPDGPWYICSVPALGGPEREWVSVRRGGFGQNTPYFTLNPDGKSLVFAGCPESEEWSGLSLLSLETREVRPLTEPKGPAVDTAPCFSPDGRTLAFRRTEGYPAGDIYTLPLNEKMEPAGEPQRLLSIPVYFAGLAWDPEGTGLVYSAGVVDGWQLWRVRLDDPERPELMEFAGTNVRFPSVS